MVSYDSVGIDEVEIPGSSVSKGETMDPNVLTVAHVDEPSAKSAGNGLRLFVFFYLISQRGDIVLKALALNSGNGFRKSSPAAHDASFSVDQYILAIVSGVMVELAHIQKASVALHLVTFKAAFYLGEIIEGLFRALQKSSLIKVYFCI